MDANPRQFGLALAEYVVHNPSVEIKGEHLGALIYRIRLVEDYSPSDVDLVAEAMRNLVKRLVELPAQTFCSEVWMSIISAVAEGAIDDEWTVMVQDVDISDLASEYMDAVSDFPSSRNPRRTGEQVSIICENLITELGLIRRFFTAIWETDLEKTMNSLMAEKWEEIDIQSDKFSSQHAIRFLRMRVFGSFMMSTDHKKVATEVYLNTLARMIIRTTLADDVTDIEQPFAVLEKVLNRMWFDLTDDKTVRKYTIVAFNKLITEGLSRQLDLQCVESFEDTCAWLKISSDEICELQDTLWSCFSSLTCSLFQLASSKSNENATSIELKFPDGVSLASLASQDIDPDNWLEKMCHIIPVAIDEKTAEDKCIRDKIDKIRKALNFILEAFMKSTSSDEAIHMMKNTYSELVSSREIEIAARVKNVYKSFVDRGVISEDDQIKLAHEIIQSNSIQEIKAIVSCTAEESKIRREIAKLYFQKLIKDMKNGVKMAPKMLEDSFECVSFLVRYLSQEVTVEVVKDMIEILPEAGEKQDFAMQIFSLVVETCSPTEFSHRDEIGWYLDFDSLAISHDTWDDIFTMIAEANLKSTEKKIFNGLTVLSMRQLTSEELSLKELLYVFKQLGYHKTTYGPNCLKKFYNETEEIKKASEKFISHSHILHLSIRLLTILSSSVLEGNEWQDYSNSLENIFLWLEEFRVINDPEITPAIINLCNKVASWQLMWNFGITAGSVNLEDIYCFSRVWKCDLMSFLTPVETEELENELDSKLKNCGSIENAAKRVSKLRDKIITKRTKPETQLVTLFNGFCMHLLAMCHKLSANLCNSENELFAWAIGVSCGGGAYSEAATNEARVVLSKKYGTHEITRLHRIHVMYYLMMGITSKKSKDTISLNDYFTSLYILLLKKDLVNLNDAAHLEDLDKYMGNLTYWMDECADTDKKSCSFTDSLMRKLGDIFVEQSIGELSKKSEDKPVKNVPFVSKFVETFVGRIDKLPNWVVNSSCPITYLSANKKLFDMIFDAELTDEQKSNIHTALENSVDILFHDDSAENLLLENKYTIQMTDKQMFSAFNITFENKTELNNEQYLIRDCLKIFSKYGSVTTLKKIVGKLNDMLPFLIRMISKHDKILDGTRRVMDDKKLVFNLMLAAELMEFCMQVSKFVFPWNFGEEQRFDHIFMMTDEDLHLQSNRATTKKDIKEEKKAEKAEEDKKDDSEIVRCTYKETGRNFFNQPWYNCFTCNMTDTTGICSVCAVNCHRGHDLSFSKRGSFFCDCGANRCQAMIKAEYEPNFKNSLRGQYPVDKKLGSSKKVRVIPAYELPKELVIEDSDKEELTVQLKNLNEQIGECQANFEKAIKSIWSGFDNSLNVSDKRKAVLESLNNEKVEVTTDCVFMEEYSEILEKDSVVPCRRTDTAAERNASSTGGTVSSNKVKDLVDVLKLENGQEVWATIPDSNQACLHLSYMDTRTNMVSGMQNVRQETETLPFVGRRLYVSGTRIVVCGLGGVVTFRLSSTGDVIDRGQIKLTEGAVFSATHTNPVVKAVWCSDTEKQILAIATIQYVRVYDLTLDLTKFVEEMVLPVGNVEDMTMIMKSNGVLQVLVLSTSGYLYEHYISTRIADNNSIFLTNIVPLPQMVPTASSGAGVSLFYSHTYDMLFVSLEKNSYCVRLPDRPEITSDDQDNNSVDKFTWRRLNLSTSVHSWKESDGIISCLSSTSPNNIFYVHIDVNQIMIQKMIVKRPILSQFLMTSSKNEAIYSVMLFADLPTVEMHVTSWKNVRDLWIDDVPTEQIVVEVAEMQSQPEKVPAEELILIHEGCAVLSNVEWHSDDLAIFYESSDLTKRLNETTMPLMVIQKQKYTLTARIGSNRHIVRGLRIEVDGVNGPVNIKIGKKVYNTESRVARIFDVIFDREDSLAFDHREIHVEVNGRADQEILCVRTLKFVGCPREIMDEVQPFYQHQQTLSLPHRFVSSFYDLNTALAHAFGVTEERRKWLIESTTMNLSRRENHPKVTISATKVLQMLFGENVYGLFEIIDGEMVKEWLYLREWDKEKGMGLLRRKHVELLIKRLQCTMTRWKVFEAQIKKYFTTILNYIELMRDEMIQMSLSTCQLMATGLVRITFGFLAQYSEESEELMKFFLNLFTDDKSYHLTSDMRSSVQFVTYHYGSAQRHSRERSLELEKEKKDHNYIILKNFGVVPFYGRARVIEKIDQNKYSIELAGSMTISEFLDQKTIDSEFVWMNLLLRKTLDKMFAEGDKNSMPQILAQMSDSPSYGLTQVAVVLFSQYSFTRVQAHMDYLISLIKFDIDNVMPMNEANFRNFALLRLLDILLGRWFANEKKENSVFLDGVETKVEVEKKSSTRLLEGQTLSLVEKGVMGQCFQILDRVVPYWKTKVDFFTANVPANKPPESFSQKVWLPHVPVVSSSANPPNAEGYTGPRTAEDNYITNATDLALRLPLLLHKTCGTKFNEHWYRRLCELAGIQNAPCHRTCKKLLLSICNQDKNKYRAMRDKFKMQECLDVLLHKYKIASQNCGGHQQLTEIVDVLNCLTGLVGGRPEMWRELCDNHTLWLLKLACSTSDVIACSVVDLMIVAVRDNSAGGSSSIKLADRIIDAEDGVLLNKIITRFLVGKEEMMRWTVHGFLRSIIQLASRQNQAILVKRLYLDIFENSRKNGSNSAQLVDLISTYAPRLFNSSELIQMSEKEMAEVVKTAKRFEEEGYSGTYRQFVELGIGWQGMLLSPNPCMVCFNKKGATESVRLASIRSDSRFTPKTMIYKLNSNYEISKVTIKLSDVKKNRQIRKVSMSYCPRAIDGVVDLKLSADLWRKCATVTISPTDTFINLQLAVPIVTSSLIIEIEDFHETAGDNHQLQCPRCSSPVRSSSGVCENCGENAYQCIKCRVINYVDREPFLCQSCGYCKYARMDVNVVCRQLPGTQHITCDAERSQNIEEMAKVLVKMENTRAKLLTYKAYCDSLWFKTRPLAPFNVHVENNHVKENFLNHSMLQAPTSSFRAAVSSMVHSSQALKTTHDMLCMQTEQLMALREELRRYDEADESPIVLYNPQHQGYYSTSEKCFGCMCASVIHSVSLLSCVTEDHHAHKQLLNTSALYDVVSKLGKDFHVLTEECDMLFVKLTMDNADATRKMERMIDSGKVDRSVFVKSLQQVTDSSWQLKLRYLIKENMLHPEENSSLEVLTILNKYLESSRTVRQSVYRKIAARRKPTYNHSARIVHSNNRVRAGNQKMPTREAVARWLTTREVFDACSVYIQTTPEKRVPPVYINNFTTPQYEWVASCFFSPFASVRMAANRLLVQLSKQPGHEGIAILMMVEWLQKLSVISTDHSDQFMFAAHAILVNSTSLKTRLFIEKFHVWLINEIHRECQKLYKKENDNLLADYEFGLRLRCYVELLCLMFSGSSIENTLLKAGADDLLVILLVSTIFLKRMVTRRNRAIDASRLALEKLLRRVSSKDGAKMMNACALCLQRMNDTNTLGHVSSVMLEVMDPQQEAEEDFLIQLEKEAAQEDFLQGRMSGNPYKSSDSGMGPLMRDIKNRICRDTEMIALMEDDNGMELLVCNNIISLALPVRQVYEKLWKRQGSGVPMLIVYRMRGLMGDAVETFISSFGDNQSDGNSEDNEHLVLLTKELVDCGGTDRLLSLLQTSNATTSGRFLLGQLRRVFERIVKTSCGRNALVQRRMVPLTMKVIRKCCQDTMDESKMTLAADYYKVIELLVADVNIHSILTGIDENDAKWLIELYKWRDENGVSTRSEPIGEAARKMTQMLESMSANLGNVVLGSDSAENVLVERYANVLKWQYIDKIENVNEKEDMIWMADQLATTTSNIMVSERGNRLKQKILDSGVISDTCSYLVSNHPPLYSPTESPEWKQFLLKPSLKLMLSLLQGLARGHQASQTAIANTTLPLLHRLEQVASENSIGTMAENVMDALKEDKEVANKIEAVRQETKMKKRQMAMAMRNKQLSKMGMQVGKSGEVKVSSRKITNEPVIEDESDLSFTCCICRESALTGPKVAAVYAFAAPNPIAPERGPNVSTVSQMVMVHLDCHNNAIRRSATGRNVDEWNKASLHNAGARCNVMTPISTGKPAEDTWNAALNRFLLDLETLTVLPGGINRQLLFLDVCKLIDRYIYRLSFSTQSHGGGRESNMQYLAIVHLLAVSVPAAENDLQTSVARYRLVTFLFTELTVASWNDQKHDVLRAALNDAQTSGEDSTWQGMRPTMLTWAFIDHYFNKVIPITGDDRLAWLRDNLRETITKTSRFVQDFDENVMVIEDVNEFCDVTGAPLDFVSPFTSQLAAQPEVVRVVIPEVAPQAPQEDDDDVADDEEYDDETDE